LVNPFVRVRFWPKSGLFPAVLGRFVVARGVCAGRFRFFVPCFRTPYMTQTELDRAVANVTGESPRTVSRLGFTIADPDIVDFDPEPDDTPPQYLDWEQMHEEQSRSARGDIPWPAEPREAPVFL